MAAAKTDKKVHLVSLGCPKNRVDSEVMLGVLSGDGYTPVDEAEDADVLVVNTCAFIGPAKEESVEAVLELAQLKAAHPEKRLVVTGCLSQRYAQKLQAEIPEVDVFLGTGAFVSIGSVLKALAGGRARADKVIVPDPDTLTTDASTPRLRSTRGGSAYLKIAEGCDNTCSFCIIPALRGLQKSRPIDDILIEAERLASSGVKELNLIAQDLTGYGHELPGRPHLADLLSGLVEVEGIAWIRMLYGFPRPLPERFWEVWESSEKILPYLDMPLQHVSATLLAKMRRPSNLDLVRRQIKSFRQRIGAGRSQAAFRTTFITGHPGETAEDHAELLRFLEKSRFERVGIFAYSDEEDTGSFELPEKVPPQLAEARRDEAMALQQTISREQQEALVGQTLEVLVEGVSEESDLLLQGRHQGQAPEIDGLTYINRGEAAPGDLVQVEITQAGDYDLVGGIPGEWGYQPEGSLPIV